ncbi:MAG: peptidase [Bacteroidetes bacterium QS_8_68_15]|nr:MAG: peptidase [Bacteroidetes bacterium QS_8_68_15]
MNRVLFLFIDGIGLGPGGASNPLSAQALPAFRALADGTDWTADASRVTRPRHVFRPLDATLGVEGLPQSGTGQATLFTGTNCAKRAGRHFGPFPHSSSKPVLAESSIFHEARALFDEQPDAAVAFANAYPPRFFTHAEERDRWTVTTRACRAAGVRLRRTGDLRAGRALAADLTADGWHEHLGHSDVPRLSPADAGRQLLRLSRDHALTVFEYYLTDKAGHGTPASVLSDLNALFDALLANSRPAEELLLITSDHGNIEDPATTTHTRNPVPLVAYGRGADAFADARDLTDVMPAALDALSATGTPAAAS